MSYTDAELLMATQLAYLNYDGKSQGDMNAGQLVESILNQYGTYDSSTGTWTMNDGVSGAAEKQFETAQNLITLSDKNNVYSWRSWKIVDSCNNENTSGFYACLIDTGDGNAIIGCRGSESYDMEQLVKDWGAADVGRLNNELTAQQADATEYMEYLYEKYGDDYDSFSITGHSLGGSLAMHSAITAPEGMQDKIDHVVSFDGPGFSDEYLKAHEEQIDRVRDKLSHYEYSWVGALLLQPSGIDNRVISATDEPDSSVFLAQLFRHSVTNPEFDENGNVIDGERGVLQNLLAAPSVMLELLLSLPLPGLWMMILSGFVVYALFAYLVSVADQLLQRMDEVIESVVEKINDIYNSFVSLVVSGEYEVHTTEIGSMADDLASVQNSINQIAAQINVIRKNLPYDSVSAYYYKNLLWLTATELQSDGRKAKKISNAAQKAVSKYNQSDQKVSTCF